MPCCMFHVMLPISASSGVSPGCHLWSLWVACGSEFKPKHDLSSAMSLPQSLVRFVGRHADCSGTTGRLAASILAASILKHLGPTTGLFWQTPARHSACPPIRLSHRGTAMLNAVVRKTAQQIRACIQLDLGSIGSHVCVTICIVLHQSVWT